MPLRGLPVQPRHDLAASDIERLEDLLYDYNQQATGYRDGKTMGFVLEDGDDLVGAVAGYTWGGICELRQVWVHAKHRGCGFGSALLDAAIHEATRRGCVHVLLTTYDFQAPGFYLHHGFEEVARVPDKPLGHTEIIMRRRCV